MVDHTRAEAMSVPRGLVLRFPFGRPFGAPRNPEQQRVVLEDALTMLSSAREPGEIRTMPYRWRREDYGRILAERHGGHVLGDLAGSPQIPSAELELGRLWENCRGGVFQ